MTLRRLSVVLLVVVLTAGCTGGEPAPAPPAQQRSVPAAPTQTGELEAVPHPETSSLEESVRQQLEDARSRLEALLEVPEATAADLAEAFGETGMIYQAYSLRQAAGACYRNARRLVADDFRWPYYLGHVSRDEGRPDEALANFERALEIRPDDLLALLHIGHMASELEQADRAEAAFRRALEIDPECAEARVGLGKLALSRRDFNSAVQQLEQARRLAPQATEINYPLGLAYRGLGDREKAAERLAERGELPAITDDPLIRDLTRLKEGMRVHQIRGTEFYQHGLYEEALAEFREAVSASPDEAVARINLGLTLAHFGDFDGARRELERAVEIEPDNDFAQYNLGRLFVDLGRDADAARHYEAALEANPNHLQAHFNLGNTLRRLGRFDEAVEHYRSVVERDPANAQARLAEAYALVRLERHAGARARLEQARAALPDDRDILHALARILAAAPDDDVRDGPRAMQLAKILATREVPLEHVVALAMIAAENGMFREAVGLQEQAIAVQQRAGSTPALAELRENLARYRNGQPCRRPWRDDHPLLSPPPSSPASKPALEPPRLQD